MDDFFLYICLSLTSILIAVIYQFRPHQKLPPSPPFSLPLIGHLHLIKHPVHQTFHKLSVKYGNIFSVRFGSRLVVVISSPSAVKECFTKNDIILANRPTLYSGRYLAYNNTTMFVSPYGEYWKYLRRISNIEVFSTNRVNRFLESREDEVKRLLKKLSSDSWEEFSRVEVSSMLLDLTSSILMRTLAGKGYCNGQEREFREMGQEILAYAEEVAPGDYIPIWNWIDPTGFKKSIMKIGERADALFQGLVDEIRNKKGEEDTMIDNLLHQQITNPDNFNDQIIKGLVQDLLLAGIDTAVTTEWALSHLLNNPLVLEKAKAEIDSFMGLENLVKETDLPSLRYLQGIILETLRLSPTAPLLSPHCASEDCKIEGHDIPRNTIIFINVWAIHRDPKLWEDATSFKPERHENLMESSDISYKLLPFGLGRRACPGMVMAHRIVGLTLASLIQCFEWERVNHKLVDMTQDQGLTQLKAHPLEAMCKPRPIIRNILTRENDNI